MSIYDSQITNESKRNSRSFKDIDLDFGRNTVTNDVNVVTNIIAIKRAVKNLVQTNYYERPSHPEVGCGVRGLLFENFTPLTAIYLKRKISEVLNNYEPRIELTDVAVDDDEDGNRLVVDIYFTIIGVQGPQQVSTILKRLR